MARTYDHNDTDADLLNDWELTGVLRVREVAAHEDTWDCGIKRHRAPRRPFAFKSAFVVTSALVVVTVGASLSSIGDEPQAVHAQSTEVRVDAYEDMFTGDVSYEHELMRERQREIERASRTSARKQHESVITQIPQVKKPVIRTPRWVPPVDKPRFTSCYGMRNGRMHKGIDIAAPTGKPIKSIGAGVVMQAGWRYSGLGYSVVVKHNDGHMTVYGHASKVLVRAGQKVTAGTTIALIGSTGHSTGPHLHLGVAKTSNINVIFSTLINPAPWLKSHKISTGMCS